MLAECRGLSESPCSCDSGGPPGGVAGEGRNGGGGAARCRPKYFPANALSPRAVSQG